jgi:hypothetical protein
MTDTELAATVGILVTVPGTIVDNVLDVLDLLEWRGTIEVHRGQLTVIAPPRFVSSLGLGLSIELHRAMLGAIILGRTSGHAPSPCTVCGSVSMTPILLAGGKPRAQGPECRAATGCPGRHEPRGCDVERIARVRAPAIPKSPTRHGKSRLLGEWPPFPDLDQRSTA